MRKTVDVGSVLDFVNGILASPVSGQEDLRRGATLVLEHVLHESGNYNGFRYLSEDEVPDTAKPGIRKGPLVSTDDCMDRFKNTDSTRRKYYASSALMKD